MSDDKKQANGTNNLPPAGYERKEELRKREDELQQKAEEAAEGVIAIDPSKLEPDREIQYKLHHGGGVTEVTKAKPGWHYVWACDKQHGFDIVNKMRQGYEVVQGKDPEAQEYKDVDTKRRLGDTILMRIPLDKYEKIEKYEAWKANRFDEVYEEGESELYDIERRTGRKIIVRPDLAKKIGPGGTLHQEAVQREAMNRVMRHGPAALKR